MTAFEEKFTTRILSTCASKGKIALTHIEVFKSYRGGMYKFINWCERTGLGVSGYGDRITVYRKFKGDKIDRPV